MNGRMTARRWPATMMTSVLAACSSSGSSASGGSSAPTSSSPVSTLPRRKGHGSMALTGTAAALQNDTTLLRESYLGADDPERASA